MCMNARNKHQNILIRKKFRKATGNGNYKCCYKPIGNYNKFSKGKCCTYPMVYKKYDVKEWAKRTLRNYNKFELIELE